MVSEIPAQRRYELEKLTEMDRPSVYVFGFLVSPLAYAAMGKHMLALLNIITLNWFLTGFITVPLHCKVIFEKAEEELAAADAATRSEHNGGRGSGSPASTPTDD